MMVSALLLSLLLSGAPQQAVEIKPNPNAAPITMARFRDNDRRNFLQNWLNDQRRLEHDRRQTRRAEYRVRMELADRLDRMISSGDCDQARALASGSAYGDIAGEVDRVCAASEAN